MIVRRLTDEGRAAFADWIKAGGVGAPPAILEADGYSETLTAEVEVGPFPFPTRYDMGDYLVDTLKPLGSSVWFDEGVWDWLSLYYIDQISSTNDGARKLQARERYVLELRNRKWSRHLVRMNWLCVREHGENARVLLTTPPNGHSEVIEQLAGQQELFGAKSLIAAAMALYWKGGEGGLKKGAQGKGAGTPRRLRRTMSQFRRTWDPHSMSAEQVLNLLPAEFNKWKKAVGEVAATSAETPTAPPPAPA